MHIRPFRSDDLDTIREITVEAFDGVSIDQNMENEFGLIAGQDWRVRKGRHIDHDARVCPEGIFVVEIDGEIAGSISTWQDKAGGIGHIPNITFRPQYRGQGLGRKLLEYALEHFRASGLTLARIETLDQNPIGDHLYRSLGFKEIAREIHFAIELSESEIV